jgi:hypothetical protein
MIHLVILFALLLVLLILLSTLGGAVNPPAPRPLVAPASYAAHSASVAADGVGEPRTTSSNIAATVSRNFATPAAAASPHSEIIPPYDITNDEYENIPPMERFYNEAEDNISSTQYYEEGGAEFPTTQQADFYPIDQEDYLREYPEVQTPPMMVDDEVQQTPMMIEEEVQQTPPIIMPENDYPVDNVEGFDGNAWANAY